MSDERRRDDSLLTGLVRSGTALAAIAAANAGRHAAATIVGYLLVAGLFATSLCFFTLSSYRALANALGDIVPSLILGAIYLVAGLVVALALQLRRR